MKLKILFEQQNVKIEEVWKEVPNFEGYYEVSNFGNIRSVERVSYYENGKKYSKRHYKGVILSTSSGLDKKNEYVTLCKDGKRYFESIYDILKGTFNF